MKSRKAPKVNFRATAVTIVCADLCRAVEFYERVLGATLIPGDGYGCPWYTLGPIRFSLMPNASGPSPARSPDYPMAMLWLETDDLTVARQRFSQFGVTVLEPGDDQFMIVADPDGIPIEVWQACPEADEGAASARI